MGLMGLIGIMGGDVRHLRCRFAFSFIFPQAAHGSAALACGYYCFAATPPGGCSGEQPYTSEDGS